MTETIAEEKMTSTDGAQQPVVPPQTDLMGSQRWLFFRASIVGGMQKVLTLIGVGENAPLSEDDQGYFDDGSVDIDFEESSIEVLGLVIEEMESIIDVANRFRHNITLRLEEAKKNEAEESEEDEEDEGDEGEG